MVRYLHTSKDENLEEKTTGVYNVPSASVSQV